MAEKKKNPVVAATMSALTRKFQKNFAKGGTTKSKMTMKKMGKK